MSVVRHFWYKLRVFSAPFSLFSDILAVEIDTIVKSMEDSLSVLSVELIPVSRISNCVISSPDIVTTISSTKSWSIYDDSLLP